MSTADIKQLPPKIKFSYKDGTKLSPFLAYKTLPRPSSFSPLPCFPVLANSIILLTKTKAENFESLLTYFPRTHTQIIYHIVLTLFQKVPSTWLHLTNPTITFLAQIRPSGSHHWFVEMTYPLTIHILAYSPLSGMCSQTTSSIFPLSCLKKKKKLCYLFIHCLKSISQLSQTLHSLLLTFVLAFLPM